MQTDREEKIGRIAQLAYVYAQGYGLGADGYPSTWAEWAKLSPSACDEWWDYAQDDLGIPECDRIAWPEALDVDTIVISAPKPS